MGFYEYPTPLSDLSIDEIVKKYENVSALNDAVLSNPKDFHNDLLQSYLHILEIDDKRIQACHNLENGQNVDQIIIMIHGLGGNVTHFEPLICQYINERTPFLAFDLPGFGDSDELETYDMLEIVRLIEKLIQETCRCKQMVIIGHSMGSILSLHLSAKVRNKVSQLILLGVPTLHNKTLQNPMTKLLLRILWSYPQILDFYRVWFDQSKGLSSSGIKDFYFREGNIYGKLYQYYRNIQIKSRSIIGYLLGWHDVNLSSIQTPPIHLIHGDMDKICPMKNLNEWKTISNKTIDIIEQCSHNCLLDATTETLQLINNFIQTS